MRNRINQFVQTLLGVSLVIVSMAIATRTTEVNAATVLENNNPSLIESSVKHGSADDSLTTNKPTIGESTIEGAGTLSAAEDYMDDKLTDIVNFLQSFVRPFVYITFILSAMSIIIGIITGSKHKFAGIIGMAFSIFVYILVVFAPEIVEYLGAWLLA
jgi:hypothetical protein